MLQSVRDQIVYLVEVCGDQQPHRDGKDDIRTTSDIFLTKKRENIKRHNVELSTGHAPLVRQAKRLEQERNARTSRRRKRDLQAPRPKISIQSYLYRTI